MNLLDVCISTTRLTMRPVSEKYAQYIFTEFTPKITTYMFPKSPDTIAETLKFTSEAHGKMKAGRALHLSIFLTATEEFLGGAGVEKLNTNTPELGIWIKETAHGNHFGKEAVEGLKQWVEKQYSYDHLIYPVDKRNIPSRKIAESLGGIQKKDYQKINGAGNVLQTIEYWIY